MVAEPPFSILRASPKSRRGISRIPASSPPLIVWRRGAPRLWILLLKALPIRVRLSISRTISLPHSSSVCIWASISSASSACSSALWSLVLATTSAPSTALRKWVTSSGRSSTSSTMIRLWGEHCRIAWTICSRITVFPALGGETINWRVPLPIGAIRSTIRMLSWPELPRSNRSCGSIATRSAKRGRLRKASGSMPPTDSIDTSLRRPFFRSIWPVTVAPLVSPRRRAISGCTITSDDPGR